MTAVDPHALIAALKAAGWVQVGENAGKYVRLRTMTAGSRSYIVPLDRDADDYQDLMDDVRGDLHWMAYMGARASRVLAEVGANVPGAKS